MINDLHFNNSQVLWAVLMCALPVLSIFIWKEWEKGPGIRFVVNSIFATLTVFALCCIFLRPSVYIASSTKGVVLTQGYDSRKLDSLAKVIKGLKKIRYNPGRFIEKELSDIEELTILGEGIHPFDFWQLNGHKVHYDLPDLPEGLVKLKYEPEYIVGDSLYIKGLYRNTDEGRRLYLQTASGSVVDSVILVNEPEQTFVLKGMLKADGKFVYQIVERDDKDNEICKNPIPVVILEKERLKVLIINQFPSFETKYLKNFLAEEGHEVVVRNQITKRKYKFEYFNTDVEPIYAITEKSLENFDLFVIDTPTFLNLSQNSRNTIDEAIQAKALGLLVQPNELLFNRLGNLMDIKTKPDKTTTILFSGNKKVKLEKYPYRFEEAGLKDDMIEDYGYLQLVGQGKKGTTLLKNTYELVLGGKSGIYRKLWTNIIDRLSKKSQGIGEFQCDGQFVFQHQPYEVKLYSGLSSPVVQHSDGYELPAIQGILMQDAWRVKTYPRYKGWNSMRLEADTTIIHDYYVMDTAQWKTLTSEYLIKANRRYFNEETNTAKKVRVLHVISPIWFFIIFVLGSGYLWLEPKLRKSIRD